MPRRAVLWLAAGLVIALSVALLLPESSPFSEVSSDGRLSYPMPSPQFQLYSDGSGSGLWLVTFSSRGTEITGLLRRPQAAEQVPGIVLLPGAGVTKESEQLLAGRLADMGYATLTLDQRDLGVTDPEADLELFMKGDEPLEHLMVHDALCAAEILRSIPGIDPDRILYAGESNGGRTAIIACALDEGSRGVLAISTCGYGVQAAVSSGILEDQQQIRFYRSIDPETYLGDLPPRMLVMLHSRNDTVIPYGRAIRTYSLARQPRALYAVGCARHGYCQEMDGYLEEALQEMAS